MKQILFASTNVSKIEEVKAIFNKYCPDVQILTLTDIGINLDDVEENASTYVGNSYLKAIAAYEKTRMPVIADDSGYEITQWNGMPGLYTHRLYKEYPVEKLDMSKSTEVFQYSAICFKPSDDDVEYYSHKVQGRLINTQRGTHDSYYMNSMIPEGYDKTFVELGPEYINEISARTLCIKELIKKNNL